MSKKKKKPKIEKKESGYTVYTVNVRKKNKKDNKFFTYKSYRIYDHKNKKNISMLKISNLFDMDETQVKYIAQTYPKTFEEMAEGMSFDKYDMMLQVNNYSNAINDFKIYKFGTKIVDFETFIILIDNFIKQQIEENEESEESEEGKIKVPKYAIMGNIRFFIDKKKNQIQFLEDDFERINDNTLIRRSLSANKENEIITVGS